MAEVYRGYDPALDRTVAIKVLLPQFARDASFVDRFRREAQAAARLNHPNIVGVYDTGADGDTQYIVMEYIEGRTLADVPRRRRQAHPDAGARVADRRSRGALAAAHAQGIDPPRHQARQHHGHARRRGEGHGLRHRAAAVRREPRPRPPRCSAPPPTSPPSRRRASRSTRAATSTRSACVLYELLAASAAVHRRLRRWRSRTSRSTRRRCPRRRSTPTCRRAWTPS